MLGRGVSGAWRRAVCLIASPDWASERLGGAAVALSSPRKARDVGIVRVRGETLCCGESAPEIGVRPAWRVKKAATDRIFHR